MTALTFPIRLAQCGTGLLISNNAIATVVASVFLGLPLFAHSFPHRRLSHPPHLFSPPISSPLPSSSFISLRWAVQSCSTTHSLVKGSWTVASSHMLLRLFPSLKSKWREIAECALTSFKIGAAGNLKIFIRRNEAKMSPMIINRHSAKYNQICAPNLKDHFAPLKVKTLFSMSLYATLSFLSLFLKSYPWNHHCAAFKWSKWTFIYVWMLRIITVKWIWNTSAFTSNKYSVTKAINTSVLCPGQHFILMLS